MSEDKVQISPALQRGVDAHRDGDLDRAKALYLEVLAEEPDNPEALHLLSAVDGLQGRAEEGEKLCRRALELSPHRAAFHNTLGELLQKLERDDEAEPAYHQALKLQPEFAAAENNLGTLAFKRGDRDQALEHFRRAVELDPELAEAFNSIGRVLNNAGQYRDAELVFRRAIDLRPGYGQAHNNLGHVLRAEGRLDEAAASFDKAIELRPGLAIAHFNLGTIYQMQNRPRLAMECFEKSIARNRLYAPAFNHLGACYQTLGRLGKARLAYKKAAGLDPGDPDASNNLAGVLQLRGEVDGAFETYKQVLERNEHNIAAASGIAALMERFGPRDEGLEIIDRFTASDEAPVKLIIVYAYLLRRMDRIAEAMDLVRKTLGRDLSDGDRADLQFAVGDFLDAMGEYDEAFENYRGANHIKAKDYDPEGDALFFDSLIEFFTPERMARLPRSGNESEEPVFIVGMPRSGTSLVEQILASHPQVFGAGELDDIGRIAREMYQILDTGSSFPRNLRFITPEDLDHLADNYLNYLSMLKGDPERSYLRTTDKMPSNFMYLGLIEMMYPRARVIHCRRNPMDTGLSCYVHNFSERALAFSYDLEHIGLFYRQYERLMNHWSKIIDLPVLELQYEELISDPEAVIRNMIEFLGLEWDDDCLRFHESRRPVDTASRHQANRPIYDTSVDRSEHYADHLKTLRRVLDGS